ncbi:HlyD family type I secretion periplasmic adaptor subunit [Magnetococcales bacterium HHB-1]
MRSNTARHLAKSVLLEESGGALIIRVVIFSSVIMVTLLLIWAWFMKLNEVSRAQGVIVPQGHIQKVQYLGNGRIAEILVKNGMLVESGTVLVRLDPLSSQSQVNETKDQIASLTAQEIRLDAFINKSEPDFSLVKQKDIAQTQLRLYQQSLRSLILKRERLLAKVQRYQAGIEELMVHKKSLNRQYQLLNEELSMRQKLLSKGLNSKTVLLALKRRQSEITDERKQIPIQILKLQAQIIETRNQIAEEASHAIENALREHSRVRADLKAQQEILKRYENSLAHLEIKAPVKGYVHGLKKHTLGEVVNSGDTLLEIVPFPRSLVAEIQIKSRDVGHIVPGQAVVIKLTTYDYARYGGLDGVVTEISPSSLLDKTGDHYHKGKVSFKRYYLGKEEGSKRYPVLPGMTLQADIITGQKNILQYLLKPIFASASQALQER